MISFIICFYEETLVICKMQSVNVDEKRVCNISFTYGATSSQSAIAGCYLDWTLKARHFTTAQVFSFENIRRVKNGPCHIKYRWAIDGPCAVV